MVLKKMHMLFYGFKAILWVYAKTLEKIWKEYFLMRLILKTTILFNFLE